VPFPAGTLSALFGSALDLILTDGSLYPQKENLARDGKSIQNTGTISHRRCLSQSGQHSGVPASMDECVSNQHEKSALLLPQSALPQSQGSYQVAVVAAITK